MGGMEPLGRMTMATNFYEQAISGLQIRRGGGVVAVNDGDSRWLVDAAAWAVARETMEAEAGNDSDEGGAEAYSALCRLVRAAARQLGATMVSSHDCVGTAEAQRVLVQRAADAGLPMTVAMERMIEA